MTTPGSRRGARRIGPAAAAAATALAVALGTAACGSDSGGAGTSAAASATAPATSAPLDPGVAYVQALDQSTQAMAGIAAAVLDPGAARGTRGPRIESELTRLEAAGTAMEGITLTDATTDAQRADLVAAIPVFSQAMRDVVAAGTEDPVNGGLELVQKRQAILDGYDAVLTADAGAVAAFGDQARATLDDARAALRAQLERLRTQAAG